MLTECVVLLQSDLVCRLSRQFCTQSARLIEAEEKQLPVPGNCPTPLIKRSDPESKAFTVQSAEAPQNSHWHKSLHTAA